MSTRAAWLIPWSIWILCLALVALTGLLRYLTPALPERFEGYWMFPNLGFFPALIMLVYPTVGALIASRRPRNPIGWLLCLVGFVVIVLSFATAYATYAVYAPSSPALPATQYAAWLADRDTLSTRIYAARFSEISELCRACLQEGVPEELRYWKEHSSGIAVPVMFLILSLLLLLFPDGRLTSRKWSVAALTALIGSVLLTLWWTTQPGPLYLYPSIDNPFGIEGHLRDVVEVWGRLGWIVVWCSLIASSLSFLSRWMESEGEERQQMNWFGCALLVLIVAYPFSLRGLLLFIVLALLPVAVGVAILRYRLYHLDIIFNRTLVYGALTACVVGIYVLTVGGLGALFQARGNLSVSLLATGLVAVLFQPLRSRLQRGVNRLMYGERDDPYAVTSRLGRRLEATLAPDAVLPTVVETIAQALKLPYVAILLKEGEGFSTAAAYGSPTGEQEALALVYQREEIGHLVLSPRAPGEGFSGADMRLLEDLARHAEVAVHAVRLTADLQRSRERLVATREEERRRLRRDLHDGLGPTLASMALRLDAARKLVRRKPEDAEEMLSRLKDQTQDTVSDVRRLVYGLRPPALDDLGLVAAVRQQAESHGFVDDGFAGDTEKEVAREDGLNSFSLEAPEDLPPLPAAVEVAAYRIAQEALTNVARHAHANTCHVRLSVDRAGGVLELEVRDDGMGMTEGRDAGVGLSSMRERAEELGGRCDVEPVRTGGTRVRVRLPLPSPKEYPQGATSSSWRAPSASS